MSGVTCLLLLQDAKGKIRVYCRVRPLLEFEAAKHQVRPPDRAVQHLRCVNVLPASECPAMLFVDLVVQGLLWQQTLPPALSPPLCSCTCTSAPVAKHGDKLQTRQAC
jgi:hypothetical protein